MPELIPHRLDETLTLLRDAKDKAISAADYPLAAEIRDLVEKYDPRCKTCGQVKPKWEKSNG